MPNNLMSASAPGINPFQYLQLPDLTQITNSNFQVGNVLTNAQPVTANDRNQLPDAQAIPINQSALGVNLGDYPIECLVLGANCPNSALGNAIVSVGSVFKKLGLLLFALVLLAFGLYMLAKSTDTGQAVVNMAKKV